MKKGNRWIAMGLAAVMFITLTACSRTSTDNDAQTGSSSPVGGNSMEVTKATETAKTENGKQTSGDTTLGEVVELKLWHMEEPPNRVKQFQEVIDRFNEEHSDIHVTIQVQSWNDAYSEFPAAIMAGNGPDILATIPDHCTVIYSLGVAQPVTDIVNKIDEQQTYYKAATEPYQYGEDIYAVPVFGMGQVLWYRTDMFKDAGLEPPTTWDELITCAKELTKDGVYGIALPASLSMATDQVIYTFMASAGAVSIIDSENNITFNNENTVKAYECYTELLKYSPEDSNTYTWGEPQALLNSGKAAMAIEKGQYLATFESESGLSAENLGCVPMPAADNNHNSKSIFYSNGFMLLSNDEVKKEAASVFFQWLLQPDPYGDYLNAEPGLFVPVTDTGSTSETYLSNEVIKKYPDQVKTLLGATENGCLFGFTDGVCMDIGKITGPNLLAHTLNQITVNGITAEEAVTWGENEMKKAIE